MTEFTQRLLTMLVLLGLLTLIFMYGSNNLFIFIIYLISLLSYYEWLRITSKSIFFIIPFFILLIISDVSNLINIDIFSKLFLFFLLSIFILTFSFEEYFRQTIKKYSILLGTLLIFSFFIFLINLYPVDIPLGTKSTLYDNRHYFIILILLISFIDVSAYVSGKLVGKNKIKSTISPNKTYEGYFGSFILTIFAFVTICELYDFEWTKLDVILLIAFIVSAFYGDFLMSLIKRVFNVKDTGSLLPGHGGFLDRIDSYFTSLPIFYFWFLS